ncbi:MAG: HAD family phosphatase [Chloroflexi bacterium]|nr:HAD family phosphatase [Chloroflexota bacterium]
MVESRLPIGLVVLDIDGTLVGADLVLGERTRAAVAATRAHGVHVAIATGRMASSAMRFAEALGLSDPLIAYQGALIRAMPAAVDPQGRRPVLGRLLVHTPMAAEIAREVVVWSRDHGLDPHLNHLERFILRADDPNADDYSSFMGARAELVPDLVAAIGHPITKVLAVGDEASIAAALPEARRRFAGRATATISHPRFIEFLAPGVSKGRAVRWLARRLGVPLAQTMAIGDQWNDLEMIEAVGHGVAMAGAPAAVIEVARHVAPPVEVEGVATILERLVVSRTGAA